MAPPPPPPPPPLCFPSFSRKPKEPKRLDLVRSNSEKSRSSRSSSERSRGAPALLVRSGSYSPTATVMSDNEKLTFDSDSESYEVPELPNISKARLVRGDTQRSKTVPLVRAESKKEPMTPSKWGYGWGVGKTKEVTTVTEREVVKKTSMEPLPRPPLHHSNTQSSRKSNESRESKESKDSRMTLASGSKRSVRPPFLANDSQSTLVGSAFERKINDVESIKERVDTSDRLNEIRRLMAKDNLDY